MSASFFRADAQGLTLALRVTPKSSRNAITGVMDLPDGQALKVAVTAAPVRLRQRSLGIPFGPEV